MVVCAGVLALSALASATASAVTAGWMVNGTLLTGSAALATTAAVDENGVLEGGGVKITCKGKTLNGAAPKIEAPSMGAASDLEFTECKAEEPCKITTSTIKTLPLLVEATLEGVLAVVATFKPQTGTIFTTLKFEGESCGLSGTTPIKGTAQVLAPTGQDERTLQLINATTSAASNTLFLGSSPASLAGSALLQLASGQSWSFL
jgi:hypothetical protein